MASTSTSSDSAWISPSSTRRKRKGRQQQQQRPLIDRIRQIQENLNPAWLDDCNQKILESKSRICGTSSSEASSSSSSSMIKVTCLGLGSPESSEFARAQLAFLLYICDEHTISHSDVSAYDPVFTDDDKSLLDELGIQVLSSEEAESELEPGSDAHSMKDAAPTILFMPHCGLALYESVLKANWTQEHLAKLLFISNHFEDYVQNNSIHYLESKAPHLLKVAPKMMSTPLPTSPDWPAAFNNTSIQVLADEDIPEAWFGEPDPNAEPAVEETDSRDPSTSRELLDDSS